MELLERPRPHIARYHPIDGCCDAAKRMADNITLHAIAGSAGRWCLVGLADGSGIGTVYASRDDAEGHKTHPAQIALTIPPGGMKAAEAEEVLHYWRDLYDHAGRRPLEMPNLTMPLDLPSRDASIRVLKGR